MTRDVTAVIPTHQRRELVLDAIAAARAQTGVDVAVVVVDDGGTDGTADAVRALGDPAVTVLRHETARRVNAARNTGLAAVATPWVAFCDDDDLWAPGKLRAQLDAVSDGPARWACVGAVHVDVHGTVRRRVDPPPSGDLGGPLARRNVVPGGGSGVLVSTALAREAGGFDERFGTLSDWEFWMRLAARSPVASVPRHLVRYLVHLDSQVHDPERTEIELKVLADKTAHDPSVPRVEIDPMWSAELAIMALRLRRWPTLLRMGARSLRSPASARAVAGELARSAARRARLRAPDPLPPPAGEDEAWLGWGGSGDPPHPDPSQLQPLVEPQPSQR